MLNIKDLLKNIEKIKISNGEYYNLQIFYEKLIAINEELKLEDDIIITPYYISEGKVLEIYDYELNIRLVDKVDIDKYLLSKTGKKSIEEINEIILDKLINCYIELEECEQNKLIEKIVKYIQYTVKSDELKKRIEKIYKSFDENKIYFEIY